VAECLEAVDGFGSLFANRLLHIAGAVSMPRRQVGERSVANGDLMQEAFHRHALSHRPSLCFLARDSPRFTDLLHYPVTLAAGDNYFRLRKDMRLAGSDGKPGWVLADPPVFGAANRDVLHAELVGALAEKLVSIQALGGAAEQPLDPFVDVAKDRLSACQPIGAAIADKALAHAGLLRVAAISEEGLS
jgi:hypothetical protein